MTASDGDGASLGDLRDLGRDPALIDPQTRSLIDRTLDEVARLRNQLAFADHVTGKLETAMAEATALNQRQSAVLEAQGVQVQALVGRLSEITALCDLAEWAGQSTGATGRCVLMVDDVRRVLAEADAY